MKPNLYLCLLSICVCLHVSGQYCGNSGPSICTPAAGATEGFSPPDTSLPCAIDGEAYNQVITFVTPASVDGYTLQSITLDAIVNLPCGLCWASDESNNQIGGNSAGCIRVTGTTDAPPGEYEVVVYVNATVSGVPVLGTYTVSGLNIDSLEGLKYFARVQAPGTNCAPVNNNSDGLIAGTTGPIATPTITGGTTVCEGGSTTLSVSGANYYAYVWSNGETGPSASATSAGSYSVTVYDNCNSATASTTLTSISSPTASVSPATDTVCSGTLLTLTASGGGTYRWSVGSTTASVNVAPTATKTYTVTVTASNSCTASASSTLTVGSSATASVSPSTVSMCSGHDTTLTATGGTSYLWSNSATTSSITVSPSSTTTYIVTVSVGSCSSTAASTVNITALQPVVSANGPISLCSGGTVTLKVTSGYVSYLWSTGDTTTSIVVSETGAYSCTVTNSAGCSGGSNVVNVSISNGGLTPTITPSNSLNLCPGGETTLDAGFGYDSYSWNVGVGTETIEVSNTVTGIYNYSVIVTQGACSGSASAAVNISNTPVNVSITPPGPVTACAGAQVVLDAGAGYSSYAWSNSDTSETIQATAAGNYYVTVTQSNACTGTAGVSVAFTAVPAVSITPSDSQNLCFGQDVTLNAGAGYDSYLWSSGDSTQTIDVYYTGNYAVTVSQDGCQATSDTVYVNVQDAVLPVISPSGQQSICSGQSLTLSADTSFDTYLWSNGASTESISVDSAGTYNLSVTLNGCSGSASAATTLSVNISPVATLVESVSDSAFAILQAGPANATFQWYVQHTPSGPDTLLANTQSSDTAYCGEGGSYYSIIASLNGCTSTSSQVEAICSGSTTGMDNIPALTAFGIQPNPASDMLSVTYDLNQATNIHISILDITGRKAMDVDDERTNSGAYRLNVNVSQLPAGIYLVNFTTDTGRLNAKFVKQ